MIYIYIANWVETEVLFSLLFHKSYDRASSHYYSDNEDTYTSIPVILCCHCGIKSVLLLVCSVSLFGKWNIV